MRSIHEGSPARGQQNNISEKIKAETEDGFLGRLLYMTTGVLLLVIFAAVGILSNATPSSHADVSDSYATTATVNVASSCSMSADPFSTDTEHTATMVNGTANTSGIGLTTIKTICNDIGGYAIYAIGYSGNVMGATTLKGANDSGNDIPTGTQLDGTVSRWAMKIGIPTNTHDTTYDPTIASPYNAWAAVPDDYQKVASYTAGTVPDSGSYITTTYAASISPTQPAGTYVGKVKYTLVHPGLGEIPTEYTMQDVESWAGELLVGESRVAKDTRNGKSYTVARLCMNGSGCDTSSTDKANSMLWMTQNLDLVLSPSTPLTSNDTNLTAYEDGNGNTFAGYSYNNGVITWTPNSTLATPATITGTPVVGTNDDMVSGWANNNTVPYQAEGGDRYNYTSGSGNNDIIYTSLSACVNAGHTESACLHYHLGNYYNYTASVAMNNSSSIADWHEVAPNSICPAGWRLPKGLQNPENPAATATVASEYNQMFYANKIAAQLLLTDGTEAGWPDARYASNGFILIRSTPVWLARSGFANGSALRDFATVGLYWSSTAVSGSLGYYLDYGSGVLHPASRDGRGNGWSLRCVAEQ